MRPKLRKLSPRGEFCLPRGISLLTNSLLNKGTAFTEREKDALGLRGLLPPRVFPMDIQAARALGNFRRKREMLDKYIFLTNLQHRNETLFYRLLLDHLEEMMPVIYTPTVGQACLEYGSIFRRPRGLWITIHDRGRVAEVLRHWPHSGVRIIVVTDGERILGLGDLGALGMGIPIGKLALYTACAGLHPSYCLPVTLDVGTENESLLADPLYVGIDQKRVRGWEYESFVDEFVWAVQEAFPGCLLQFEDFATHNAFGLLHRYRDRICTFNDDIQGTAAVALAGLLSALRIRGGRLRDQRVLFLGAGEAATGIADLLVEAVTDEGLSRADALRICWFYDSNGLVHQGRSAALADHKRPYAHEPIDAPTFLDGVRALRPTAIIGACGTPGTFTEPVVRAMAQINAHPIVFALSNPTSKAECTSEDAYRWSDGRAIFASGSPFPPVPLGDGRTLAPGQSNNVYIFPGVGLGVLVAQARQVTTPMFLAAARALAGEVTEEDLAVGRVYPALNRIRQVSMHVAAAVCTVAHDEGIALAPHPPDIEAAIASSMFEPTYTDYV